MSPSSAWPSSVLRWSKPLVGQPVKCTCSDHWMATDYLILVPRPPTAFHRPYSQEGDLFWHLEMGEICSERGQKNCTRGLSSSPPRRNVKTPLSNNDNLVFSRSSNYAPLGTQIQRSQTALLPGYLRPQRPLLIKL
ncbi:hypothetical protein M404DRAFT_678011 [Pisolithus tinctorius Marx 270]|uniref:Uncharacterized protein n=1 Tax=Pisolithus tinctorius Marx 270 TaxID=870435 RepID=A0A0C3JTJ3_PISTI|nr:hypothetical protein M404DRAFT_678011 [Pisolithus tinctorius Marx 270]